MIAQMPSATAQIDPAPQARLQSAPVIAFLIVASVLVLFGPICRNGFVAFDDDRTIQYNPHVTPPSIANVAYFWRHAYMDLYVPVTYTAWSGLAALSRAFHSDAPPDPAIFHAASVALHAINAVLVFLLLRRFIPNIAGAAAGALLFVVHPVQVETVAWASGMKDLLCATFSLIAVLEYVRAILGGEGIDEQKQRRRRAHYIAGLTALLVAMLCKPTAMVTPVIVAIIDLILLNRSLWSVSKSIAPWLILAIACAVWTKLCQPSDFRRPLALWQRPFIAGDALAFYLFKIVWPVRLTHDYGRTPWLVMEHGWGFVTWIVPASGAVTLFVFRKRVPTLAVAGLLFVAGVLPVLGLTQFDFQVYSGVADHYLYLAMIGPALAAAWIVSRSNSGDPRIAIAATAVIGMFALRTSTQTRYWYDDQTLFTHALEINPRSWGSYFALGTAKQNRARELASDPKLSDICLLRSMELYRKTIDINPNHLAAEHRYATILMHFGRWNEAATALADVVARRDRLPLGGRDQFARDDDLLRYCRRRAAMEAARLP